MRIELEKINFGKDIFVLTKMYIGDKLVSINTEILK